MHFVIDYGNARLTTKSFSFLDEKEIAIFSMLQFLKAKEMVCRGVTYRIF